MKKKLFFIFCLFISRSAQFQTLDAYDVTHQLSLVRKDSFYVTETKSKIEFGVGRPKTISTPVLYRSGAALREDAVNADTIAVLISRDIFRLTRERDQWRAKADTLYSYYQAWSLLPNAAPRSPIEALKIAPYNRDFIREHERGVMDFRKNPSQTQKNKNKKRKRFK